MVLDVIGPVEIGHKKLISLKIVKEDEDEYVQDRGGLGHPTGRRLWRAHRIEQTAIASVI